jgi:hypothetical protein
MSTRMLRPSKDLMRRLSAAPDDPSCATSCEKVSRDLMGAEGHDSGVIISSKNFVFQSYFDGSLHEHAILTSSPSDQIIQSTRTEETSQGYGVLNHSTSAAPITVELVYPGRRCSMVLRPGEMFISEKKFDAVNWGLPSGWLGGGLCQLRIIQSHEDFPLATGSPEILFHRQRVAMRATTDNPATVPPNWPIRFPWPNAVNDQNKAQGAQPLINIIPTKILLRLFTSGPIVGDPRCRLLILKTDDFDLQSDGVTYNAVNGAGTFVDFRWPSTTQSGFQIGGLTTAEFPLVTLDAEVTRIGGDNAIMVLIDIDGALAALMPLSVDIERWGTLGTF